MQAFFGSGSSASNGSASGSSNKTVAIVLGILIPLGLLIALGILLWLRSRRRRNATAVAELPKESGHELTENMHTQLAEAKQSCLAQRDASIQRKSRDPHSTDITFHPSDLSSEYSRPHVAGTTVTARSGSSSLSEPPFTIAPLVVRRAPNQGMAPPAATFPRPMREDFYPRSNTSTSTPTPVPSSPTLSNHVHVWRQPRLPMQYSVEKHPNIEYPRAVHSIHRSDHIVPAGDGQSSYELDATSTHRPEVGRPVISLNRESQPVELE